MNNDEQMLQYEADVMALPPLRLVLNESPSIEAEGRGRFERRESAPDNPDMELAVKRTIAFLLKKK